jgi:hypothetical protein
LKKRFGRKEKLEPAQKEIIAERYLAGETIEALAQDFRVGVATIHRALGPRPDGADRRRGRSGRKRAAS